MVDQLVTPLRKKPVSQIEKENANPITQALQKPPEEKVDFMKLSQEAKGKSNGNLYSTFIYGNVSLIGFHMRKFFSGFYRIVLIQFQEKSDVRKSQTSFSANYD